MVLSCSFVRAFVHPSLHVFIPLVGPAAYSSRSRRCVHVCIRKNCEHDILQIIGHIFTKLTPLVYYGTMALNGLYCADVPLSNYSLTHVLWDRGECIKFGGQKVKVQGYGGITYAGTVTVQAEACSTRHLVSS